MNLLDACPFALDTLDTQGVLLSRSQSCEPLKVRQPTMTPTIKPPPYPTPVLGQNQSKALYKYRDGYARYYSRDSRQNLGFGNYNLERDGLLGIHRYGSGAIERIVRDRHGEPYLMGIEIEIEGTIDRRSEISETLQKYLPDRHICVPDGSLDSTGIEVVTAPLAPKEVNRIGWYRLVRQLSRLGCRSHDGDRCGLHISISRTYLRAETWRALRRWIIKQRPLLYALSRRTSQNFAQYTSDNTKYAALNLTKSNVGEFRFFRGTLKPSSFLASVEIVRSLVEFARGEQDKATARGSSVRTLGTRAWVKLVGERFPIAHEYIGDRYSLLVTSTERSGTGTRRARLTQAELTEQLRQELYRIGRYGTDYYVGTGTVGDRTGYLQIRSRWAFGSAVSVSAELSEAATREMPINWAESTIPARVRRLLERGASIPTIAVRSRYTTDQAVEIRLAYNAGGWGRRSWYEPRIMPVTPTIAATDNNQ